MPYRHAGPGLCTVCNGFTAGARCQRCGRPLCEEHPVRDGRRCTDCEAEYAQMATLLRSVPIVVAALQVVAVVCICMMLVLVGQLDALAEIGPCLSLAGGVMTAIFLSSLGVILQRRRCLRERFLAERWIGPARSFEPVDDPSVFLAPVRF